MTTSATTALAIRPEDSGGTLAKVAATPGFVESIEKMGAWFHESDMFGCKKPQQGKVLALACAISGENPFKIMAENMIVEGRLTRRYELMLSDLRRAGGDYDWIDDGEDGQKATIEIVWKGKTKRYSYTMEMAKRAQIVKPNSGWDKRPGNMLRSKAVRNGLQMFAPEVLGGALTPEDALEIADEEGRVSAAAKPTATDRKKRQAELQQLNAAGAASESKVVEGSVVEAAAEAAVEPEAAQSDVIDVEPTPAATEEPPFEMPTEAEMTESAKASAEQLRKLVDLMNPSKLNIPWAKYLAGLKKDFSVDRPDDLTPDQANALITKFEAALAKKRAGATATTNGAKA
ncbi:MAG: recombinase RecT [Planctomycetaceae bacterium]|nr:recombinase RecT [Planctomycetaceae bacterium]